jgi:hypothetical protein
VKADCVATTENVDRQFTNNVIRKCLGVQIPESQEARSHLGNSSDAIGSLFFCPSGKTRRNIETQKGFNSEGIQALQAPLQLTRQVLAQQTLLASHANQNSLLGHLTQLLR